MPDEIYVVAKEGEDLDYSALPEPVQDLMAQQTAGGSTCPMCGLHWAVTALEDCFMPSCGHYGDDASEANSDRPCEPCGLKHAMACPDIKRGSGG